MNSKVVWLGYFGSIVHAIPQSYSSPPVSNFSSTTEVPTITLTVTPNVSSTSYTAVPSGSRNPCAEIASLAANAPPYTTPIVSAQLGFDCLNDVPLDATAAVPWLESLKPYINWQSTLTYLKNPPAGYLEPAIDVFGELDKLIAGVKSGLFKNEYELELELYRIFQRTHDGHFRYSPNLIANVLNFGRPVSLVSVSIDGSELPKPYVYTDILWSETSHNITPSAVTKINGEDATNYLINWSQYGSLQDPDALYNNVFYSLAQASLASLGSGPGTFAGAGRGAYIFPGPTTTLEFENGTTSTYENFARVLQSFANINSSADVYSRYVKPTAGQVSTNSVQSQPDSAVEAESQDAPVLGATLPGFPPPVLEQINHFIGGYYLNGSGYQDVAVLAVPSFVSFAVAQQQFQDTAFNFINQAKKDGKTKLLIDVSANGGGTILQGYSLFTNLFPDLFPYGATRFRAQEALDVMGQTVSDRITTYPFDPLNPPNATWSEFLGTPLNYRTDVDINNKNFDSWAEKYGPHAYYGDNFTSIIRWNLSDPTNTFTSGITVNGFLNRTGIITERPFEPENIVILYDGYCASTCTIFSEFMRQQGGVKTIAIGGRPQANTPMQAVGGVKGTNNYPHSIISILANATYKLAPDLTSYFDTTALGNYKDNTPFLRSVPGSGQLNVRDGIREGDATETPLQFIYEPADCRIWYTPEMTVDVSSMWEKAADVSWNGDRCVYGSVSGYGGFKRRTSPLRKIRTRHLNKLTADKLEKTSNFYADLRYMPLRQGFMAP